MDDQDTGVTTQPEAETGADSPISAQTTDNVEAEAASASETTDQETKAVPYERFKEVNDRYRQTEEKLKEIEARLNQTSNQPSQNRAVDPQEAQVKEVLKQYGFVSKDEVEAEINRLKEDQALEQTLSSLEKRYSGKDGRPKFNRQQVVEYALNRQIADPEVAYKALHEKDLLNWHIENASKKQTGVKAETSDGSGAKPAGASQDQLYEAAMAGNQSAMDTLISRTNVFQKFFGK